MTTPPQITEHDGILVARDDLFPGGTKARFIGQLFQDAEEIVYASPMCGGAQTALAIAAQALGKRATIFVAERKEPHARSLMAKRHGALVLQVKPGYLTVVQARAREYAADHGAKLAPFGFDVPEATETIAAAAVATGLSPAEVWCASGSGVLARALARAFPSARRFVVQVGRDLTAEEVLGATIIPAGMPFEKPHRELPPFPSDPHYDAKAWHLCRQRKGEGPVLFWNVTGPAEPA